MGLVFNRFTSDFDVITRSSQPILFCGSFPSFETYLNAHGYTMLSLNEVLAKRLIKYPKNQRGEVASDLALDIIMNLNCPVYLHSFEMLFDPKYKIDIFRLFFEVSRRQRLVINWCGLIDTEHLKYSEPGYLDYKSFNISDYEVTCLI